MELNVISHKPFFAFAWPTHETDSTYDLRCLFRKVRLRCALRHDLGTADFCAVTVKEVENISRKKTRISGLSI